LFTTHRFKSGKYWMTTPTEVTQYAEAPDVDIAWDSNLSFLPNNGIVGISTVKPLLHISRSPKLDLTYKTWFIQATGFNFTNLPDIISNIKVTVNMNRGGRVSDDTIQLCYQGSAIGENRAQPAYELTVNQNQSLLQPTTNYEGNLATWKIDNLTASMAQDSSFGVLLRYRSHPSWPHKTSPMLYSVSLQIE